MYRWAASLTSAPPACEDEDEAEETIYFDTRDEVVHPESDDLLEEAPRRRPAGWSMELC